MTSKTPVLKSRVAVTAIAAAVLAGLILFLGGPDRQRVPSADAPADAPAAQDSADASEDAG